MKDKYKKIAFDLNGTLIGTRDPDDAIALQLLLKRLKKAGHTIIVWSGYGVEEAKKTIKELELEKYVDEYKTKGEGEDMPDIAFDDNHDTGFLAKEATILV
jgi:phosphoglycolate phosphatase-like HAD superfamily hydrolase